MTPEERNDLSFQPEEPRQTDADPSRKISTESGTAQPQTADSSPAPNIPSDGGERSIFEDRFSTGPRDTSGEKQRRQQEQQEKRAWFHQAQAEKQAWQQQVEQDRRHWQQQAEQDRRFRQQQAEEEKRQRQEQAAEERRLRQEEAARIRAEEREEKRQRRSLRRMGTLTLGLTCIALGCAILWWMTHPGAQLTFLQWFGPAVIILLGVEILLCHLLGPKKFRFDFGSLFISFCALGIALVMSFIPMALWYFGPQRYEARAEFEAAETQRIQSLLKDCSQVTSLYVNSSLSYNQFYDPLSPPDNTPDFVSVSIELTPVYTASEDFAQSASEVLAALTADRDTLPNRLEIHSSSQQYDFGLYLRKDYMGDFSPESLLPLVEYRVSDEILGQTITIADGSGSIVYPPVFSLDLYGLPEELWEDVIAYYQQTYGVTVEPVPSEEDSLPQSAPPEAAAELSDGSGEETAAQPLPDSSSASYPQEQAAVS